MVGNPTQLKTVCHIPREISRQAYFFLNGRERQNYWFSLSREVMTLLHPNWRIENTTIKF